MSRNLRTHKDKTRQDEIRMLRRSGCLRLMKGQSADYGCPAMTDRAASHLIALCGLSDSKVFDSD